MRLQRACNVSAWCNLPRTPACSHENVQKKKKKSTLFLELFQVEKATVEKTAEFGREWTQPYIVLCKGRYFGQEGVKTECNPCRQKLLVSLTLVNIIIGRAAIKSVFSLWHGSIFTWEILNSLAGKAGQRFKRKKKITRAKKQVT